MIPALGAVALVTSACLLAAPQDRYARPDPFDASVRTLRESVRLPTGGARSPSLMALIELRDPELRPLFQSLIQRQDRPVMQADAIVGLALGDPRRTIDPFTLRQIEDKALRSEVIKTLLGRDLIRPAEIREMLRWPPDELTPEDRLFLVAALARDGKAEWDASDLESISDTKVAELQALLSLLLLEKGDAAKWEAFRGEVSRMQPGDRSALLTALAPAIRTYKLESAVQPLLRLAADRDIDPNVRAAIVGSALELDPAAGMEALRVEVRADRSPRNLLRYALLLLVVSEKDGIDPEIFSEFDGSGSAEIDALVAAGRCAKGGPGCADALTRVVDLIRIRPAAEWVIVRAGEIGRSDPETARIVLNHILDLAPQARDPREPILIVAVRAAEQLVTLDGESLRKRLEDPSAPTPILESISVAMIDAGEGRTPGQREAVADLAASLRGKLSRRFNSMVLVAAARAGATLTPGDVEQLGVIAAGGGRVEEPVEVQAAWLYLKASGRHKDALARLSPE